MKGGARKRKGSPTQCVKGDDVDVEETPKHRETKRARIPTMSNLTPLQMKMRKRLDGSRFRWINEQLYTTTGAEAWELFQKEPKLFDTYHTGYETQVAQWPQNPLDLIIDELKKEPPEVVIADFGCGTAKLSASLPRHKVHSFDLVAANDRVTACNIAHVPLPPNSVDIAVFCLSLMGTDFKNFLKEAHRVLKTGGKLKIAEASSRMTDGSRNFVHMLKELGFTPKNQDHDNPMFSLFEFIKNEKGPSKRRFVKPIVPNKHKNVQMKPKPSGSKPKPQTPSTPSTTKTVNKPTTKTMPQKRPEPTTSNPKPKFRPKPKSGTQHSSTPQKQKNYSPNSKPKSKPANKSKARTKPNPMAKAKNKPKKPVLKPCLYKRR